MIRRFLLKILVSAGALWVADAILAGFTVSGGIRGYLLAGLVLGTLNTFVRPILKLMAFPLILATLGFFTIVINAFLLWIAADWLVVMNIAGPLSLLWATLIISAVHLIVNPKS